MFRKTFIFALAAVIAAGSAGYAQQRDHNDNKGKPQGQNQKQPAKPQPKPGPTKPPAQPRQPARPSQPVQPLPVHGVNKPSNPTTTQKKRTAGRTAPVPNRSNTRYTAKLPTFQNRDERSKAWASDGRRAGFDPHRPGFTLNNFNFRHYQDHSDGRCYPSPWYYYPGVPAYVLIQFTFSPTRALFAWEVGGSYHWEWHHHEYDGAADLDDTIDRIQDCFIHGSSSELTPLLPTSYTVDVEMDGQPRYLLSAPDFQNMLGDVVAATDTVSYTVSDVWRNGKSATVVAEHDYRDSFGNILHQRHWYGLRQFGADYRIVAFKSQPM